MKPGQDGHDAQTVAQLRLAELREAAKILGVSERSLWYRIKKLGIQVRTPDDAPSA